MTFNSLHTNQRHKFNWLFKYKLYHLPFWFAYHYMWWTLTIGSVSQVFNNIFHSPYVFKFLFAVIFQAIGVYFNLYFLVPKLLEKDRYVEYIACLLATIVCTAALLVGGYYTTAWWSESTFEELFNMKPDSYLYIFKANALSSTVASMTLAMSVKLAKKWIQANTKQQTLEKEKLEAELKFLRSQFNPHFLFNTINSIFVLIHKNPDMASEALAKFSDLLRYQLYECNDYEIPVQQELSYLQNFIELEKLRLDSNNVTVTLQISQAPNASIAPFILIPFVENAFKHVSKTKEANNWISISLYFKNDQLKFRIVNSSDKHNDSHHDVMPHQGIGLKNVKRRLDLMYAGRHELIIERNNEQFCVELAVGLRQTQTSEFVMPVLLNA